MTESEIRKRVVDTATAWLGAKRGGAVHKKIIDTYNNFKPKPSSYKVTYTNAWCATFVSAVFIAAGFPEIAQLECSCSRMINLYKKVGRWEENDAYVPKPGDVLMYDWDDNGKGDCTGAPEHVGLVVAVEGGTIKVIEGNKSNAVGYRNVAVNGRYIRGFCLPDYKSKATASGGAHVVYKVVKGDTMSKIAARFKTSVNAIVEANKGKYGAISASHVVVGWNLDIPG